MKTHFLLLCLFIINISSAQNNVGIGTNAPNPSALVDISASDRGVLIPRMTAAQRVTIASPINGLLVYQTDGTSGFYYFNSPFWVNITAGTVTNANGASITISPNGNVTTLAGTGGASSGNLYDPVPENTAVFSSPSGIALNPSGTSLRIGDANNYCIRIINLNTGIVGCVAGGGSLGSNPISGNADGTATSMSGTRGGSASFGYPCGVTYTSSNIRSTFYVADRHNNTIRKVYYTSFNTDSVITLGPSNFFNKPFGVALDGTGQMLYVSDMDNHRICQVNTATGVVNTLAGSSVGTAGFADATGTNALFNHPAGIALDKSGNFLYVADSSNNRIRKVTIPGGVVTTLVGNNSSGAVDGIGTAASLKAPASVAIDGSGNVYVADGGNNKIRKVKIPEGVITTLAGDGSAGATDGYGTNSSFNKPISITVDNLGENIYVADLNNNKIRQIKQSGSSVYVTSIELENSLSTREINTPFNSINNMLPVAYGSLSSGYPTSSTDFNSLIKSSSSNFVIGASSTTGDRLIRFTSGTLANLSKDSLNKLPVVFTLAANTKGFISWEASDVGTITVYTYDSNGTPISYPRTLDFSFVIYKP